MATNAQQVNGASTQASRFDPNFTESVINANGPKANPRLAKVMASLTRHLHDFCRENEITIDEYMAGIDMVSESVPLADEVCFCSRHRSTVLVRCRMRSAMKDYF